MIAAIMLLSCSLAAQSAPPPEAGRLVELLGSSKFSEREDATRQLEALGAAAIPSLMAGRESKDLEIRTRSAAILRRVQGALLTQPTMIRADFEDTALADLVRMLGERTGMSISLNPENLPRWRTERVTLREGEPIPFWQFMDRLCGAARLDAELVARGSMVRGGTALRLSHRGDQPVYPTLDHGPFRVRLVDLEFRHSLNFSPPTPLGGRIPPKEKEQAREPARSHPTTRIVGTSRFQIMAEPRLSLSHNGPFVLLEARDDQGNSLLPENRGSSAQATRTMGYMGASCTSILHLQAVLNHPENPGRTIKILRGNVPLLVAARQSDPLIVSLTGAAGRSFAKRNVQLTVHEIRSEPKSKRRQIDLSIEPKRSDSPGGSDPQAGDVPIRVELLQRQLEIVDDRGRLLPWFQSSVDMEARRLTLTLNGLAGSEPHELHFFELTQTAVELPFAFSDIPLP